MPNPYGWGQNEPQIKPKDQGGDTIATFSQKIYNLFDNLFDTLNSYPWSTATQSDAGYMSAADKATLDNDVEIISSKTYGTIGYIYYKSGLQICWGLNVAPAVGGSGNTVTYPRAYKSAPFAFVTRRSGASTTGVADSPWIREPLATSMNIYVPVYTGYYWLTIGEGVA